MVNEMNIKNKKVLVTGGAGFIGSNLVDALAERGDEVVVIDDLSSGKREYINPAAKFYHIDICSEKIPEIFAAEKFDIVFHLAAQIDVARSVKDPFFDNKVNAFGSLNIFLSCLKYGVKRIVFTSTGGALYGDVTAPAREEDPVVSSSLYAIHKHTAERYLEMKNRLYGQSYVILRLANVYGPRQYKGAETGVISIFTHNAAKGIPSILYGDGSKTRDYVFVDDVIRAIILAADSGHNDIFNIGSGRETSTMDIINKIERIVGGKFVFSAAADKPGEVLRSALDHGKAKRMLGWEPELDLETGIRKTLDWLKNCQQ